MNNLKTFIINDLEVKEWWHFMHLNTSIHIMYIVLSWYQYHFEDTLRNFFKQYPAQYTAIAHFIYL